MSFSSPISFSKNSLYCSTEVNFDICSKIDSSSPPMKVKLFLAACYSFEDISVL